MKNNRSQSRIFVLTAVLCLLAGAAQASSDRKDYLCSEKPDPMFGKCSVQVNAITRTTNGVEQKGHLVYCQQQRAYSCVGTSCEENYGRDPKQVSYNLPMDDYTGFCKLLCKYPECKGQWVAK